MGKKYQRPKPLSVVLQEEELKKKCPNIIERIEIHAGKLVCIMKLKPSAQSDEYTIRVEYKLGERPKAWLLFPKLERVNGKIPHHLYGYDKNGHPELCVYYPDYGEWDANRMFLADTFVPWIVTWLNTYEYWLLTGAWIYEESPRKVKKKKRKEY